MKQIISIIIIVCLVGIGFFSTKELFLNSNKTETISHTMSTNTATETMKQDTTIFNANTPAPELTGITKWFNTEKPVTLEELKGNVVMIDFWTNQCINCIHALPYVTKWYDTYKDQGFVVIGVHTPELAYERTVESIEKAITQYGIHYPVAQDNDYKTWNTYSNQYWPALYLIDKKGKIRRSYFGEGEYEQTELAIQTLLKEVSE